EKNKQIGGRMNQIKKDGFTFDMGPTIVMMPEIYRDVFNYAHRNMNDYLEIKQLSHIYDVYFSESDQIRVPTDLARSEEHTSELQSRFDLVCRLLLEKKKQK